MFKKLSLIFAMVAFIACTTAFGQTGTNHITGPKIPISFDQRASGDIIISDDGDYSITSSGTGSITVNAGVTATVDLNGCTISNSTTNKNIVLNYGTLTIYDSSTGQTGTIDGKGVAGTVAGRGIRNEGTLYFESGTLTNCKSSYNGGGVANLNGGVFYFRGGTISSCCHIATGRTTLGGGGIYNRGTLYLEGGLITNCYARWYRGASGSSSAGHTQHHFGGGGVFSNSDGTIVMSDDCTIDGCYVYGDEVAYYSNEGRGCGGGGILTMGTMTMNGGTIQNCEVRDEIKHGAGGGILNTENGVLTINDGLFQYNTLGTNQKYGGAVANWGAWYSGGSGSGVSGYFHDPNYTNAKTYIKGGIYQYNESKAYAGGGIGNAYAYLEITGGLITQNTAGLMGGGVINGNGGDLYVGGDVVISYNKVTNSRNGAGSDDDCGGGGLCIGKASGENKFTMTGGSIIYNQSDGNGGGIYMRDVYTSGKSNDIQILGGLIAYNEAGTSNDATHAAGGGLYTNGDVTIKGGEISNNYAYTTGGGIHMGAHSANLVMKNGLVQENTSRFDGGGIYITGGSVLKNVEFSGGKFIGNTAERNGGGFYILQGNITINSDSTDFKVNENHATGVTTGGTTGIGGGFCVSNGNLAITSTNNEIEISENTSDKEGAGFYMKKGDLAIAAGDSDMLIDANVSDTDGGGFYIKEGNVHISSSDDAGVIVSNNEAVIGGGFYVDNGTLLVESENTSIESNAASEYGAGFYCAKGVTVDAAVVYDNHSDQYGGGFYCASGTTIIKNGAIVEENHSAIGGGVYVLAGTLTIQDSGTQIIGNTATTSGGGVYSNGGTTTINDGVEIDGNSSNENGGGLYIGSSGSIVMNNGCSITNNTALRSGGGLYTEGIFTINGGTLSGNRASFNDGGAVYAANGSIVLNSGVFSANYAENGNGGAIYTKVNMQMDAGTISGNRSKNGGGLYVASPAIATLTNGGIIQNKAINGGGVYICDGATLELYKSATIQSNQCGDNDDPGQGGGVFQNGTMKVAGNSITVSSNSSITMTHPATNDNVHLVDKNDVITVVDWTDPSTGTTYHGVDKTGSVNIGIRINSVPHPVIYSATPSSPGHLTDLYDEVHEQTFNLKDDLGKYQAVYADGPDPYNLNNIFFTATWQMFAFPEGVTEFKDSDRAEDHDTYFGNINTPELLAEFMCYVNGLNGYTAHKSQNGKVTDDLDMSAFLWLPIGVKDGTNPYTVGLPHPYDGTFDGGGNVISGLNSIGLMGLSCYGLFGATNGATIKNTFVIDADFVSNDSDTLGIIVGKFLNGSKMYYSEGAGNLTSRGDHAIIGGLVGYSENSEIHSCMAMPAMTNNGDHSIMGGLIGKMASTGTGITDITFNFLRNCFANPQFTTTSSTAMGGGLIGYAEKGKWSYNSLGELVFTPGSTDYAMIYVTECYDRLDRAHSFPATNNIAALCYHMPYQGFMAYAYFPTYDRCGQPGHSYINKYRCTNSGELGNFGQYTAVSDPGTYEYDPMQDTKVVEMLQGVIPDADSTLLTQLQRNAYIRNSSDHPNPPICYWKRTGASAFMASGKTINGDYPILDFDSVSPLYGHDYAPYYIALGSKDGIAIDYCVSLSSMLRRYNRYENGGDINLFHSIDNSKGSLKVTDEDVRIYCDEGVTLLQGDGGYLNAVCYQTLRQSTDYWHTFSTAMGPREVEPGLFKGMSNIGFIYGNQYQVPFVQDQSDNPNNPCNVQIFQGDDPSNPNDNYSIFPRESPMDSIDLYAFFENQYHWVNFKRNSLSHWHMDNHTSNISYTNETYLMPGKGYLIALAPEKKIYEYGVLNCGKVESSSRTEDIITHNSIDNPYCGGYDYAGYNLLGNPYLAYLNFNEFAKQNKDLWSGSHSLDYTAFVYDADYDLYLGINADVTASAGSIFPGQWLAPHQGFFIVKTNEDDSAPTTAKFVETSLLDAGGNYVLDEDDNPVQVGMCSLTGDGGLLRDEAYPLVNFIMRDAQGHGDVMSVEFDHSDLKGIGKQKVLRSGDAIIFTRFASEDYALLQLDQDVESLPIYFNCLEGGTYTLTWNTANGNFTELTLVDNLTGVSTDCLSHDSYTFEGAPSDYASRFKLIFSYTTEESDNEDVNANDNFAFISNGELVVNGGGSLEIIDVNGRVIRSEQLTNAENHVSMPAVAAGVYVIRLNDKSQKIVVK